MTASTRSIIPYHPSAERLAHAVSIAMALPQDPTTLTHWARALNISVPSLRAWCYVASVKPRSALILARLLRAILMGNAEGTFADSLLEAADPRTIERVWKASGIAPPRDADLNARQFLLRQRLVTAPDVIVALARLMDTRVDRGPIP